VAIEVMDYDTTAIATTYDSARTYSHNVLQQWLDVIATHLPFRPQLIVDLGCGTGRYAQALADRFESRVIGIDPSERMLAVARAKPGNGRVEFRRASAHALPLDDGCADMVFMSMVLHHLTDPPAAAGECRRILREGGRMCIRNGTREAGHSYPVAHFFPGIVPMLESDLPSRQHAIRLFEDAGLTACAHQVVTHTLATDWQAFANKMALRADSFLARLPDREFEAGLAELRRHAAVSEPEEITEPVDFFVFERRG
jgi:ubiquinone/menaquinone biosynthesis C-methylase UbiE